MDIRAEILKEHSKNQVVRVVNFIGSDTARFEELVKLFLQGPYRVTQRAAWPLSYCVENYPILVKPHLNALIQNLEKDDVHVSVKRNVMRLLQFVSIPKRLYGKVIDISFRFLQNPNEPIAVKVFAMSVLANLIKDIPELKAEVKLVIEDQLPYASAGFKARAKSVLKLIQ